MAQKAVDEVFCRSCGEAIKKEAEICPHCGVRNQAGTASSKQQNSSVQSTIQHDPSQYETTVSNNWWYGVLAGTGLWIFVLIFASFEPTGGLSALLGFLALIAWGLMPVAIFFDAKYVRANSQWNPNSALYIVGSLIWVVNIITGAVYVYRRHESLGEP